MLIAHKNRDQLETLDEHSEKTLFYGRLFDEKSSFYDRMRNILLKVLDKSILEVNAQALVKEYIKNIEDVLYFHDIGKINKYFQKTISGENIYDSKMREHAIVSSSIYFYEKTKYLETLDLDIKDKQILNMFNLLNSWVISRHHTHLNEYTDFCNSIIKLLNNPFKMEGLRDYANFDDMVLFYGNYKRIFSEKPYLVFNTVKETYLKNDGTDSFTFNTLLSLYTRMVYGFLNQSDYLATGTFMNGKDFTLEKDNFPVNTATNIYYNSPIHTMISANREKKKQGELSELDEVRLEILDEVMYTFKSTKRQNTYLIEAMTGVGKTNIATKLSLAMLKEFKLKKLMYVFPFNSLVEQTKDFILQNTGVESTVMNSIEEIKLTDSDEEVDLDYDEVYMNRLRINYPSLMTSHVKLFNMLFGTSKDSSINLINLHDSVLILDEIHAYTPRVWELFVKSLDIYASILNIKVVYMSATMPNFSRYIPLTKLVPNFNVYSQKPTFKNRVTINKGLVNICEKSEIFASLEEKLQGKKRYKNLVGFITKKDANQFYTYIKDKITGVPIYLITSDTRKDERVAIIEKINNSESIIVIATQVIEVGVDIDMHYGYFNVRTIDSMEQIMGRVNRNNKQKFPAEVYPFLLTNPETIYQDRYVQQMDKMLTLLETKNYGRDYFDVMQNFSEKMEDFSEGLVSLDMLNYISFSEYMTLIKDETVSVYLEESLEAIGLFEDYKETVQRRLPFSKKKVVLHNARVRLNKYTYNVAKSTVERYNDSLRSEYGFYIAKDMFWL